MFNNWRLTGNLLSVELVDNNWYIDNGASCHITREGSVLHDASKVESTCYVRCGTHIILVVKRLVAVTFQLELDYTLELARVLYIPQTRVIVLSVSALEDEGYALHF